MNKICDILREFFIGFFPEQLKLVPNLIKLNNFTRLMYTTFSMKNI